ncbi:MAG: glycosyltransferase family 4 protein, partial [candidate division WOR-3 bacterium]|nr:glycosyltransferase family 4 protein [candidate division WOR-3 bacterium]
HAHYLTPYGYFILPAKCTTIISLWGSDIRIKYSQSSGLFRRFLNRVMNKADILMIPGDYMLDYLDFSRKNIIETIWGIDAEHIGIKNDQEKNLWNFHNDEYIITSIRVNRDIFQIERIIDAVYRICESGYKVKLNLIEGPYTEYNKIIRNKCRNKQFVNIYNHLSHEQYVSLLRATDIAVSIALEDAGPVSVKESMALGLPVIYQDIEGINRTIDSSTGFPLSTRSKDELIEVINTIINDTGKREMIARNAREFAISSFSQKTYISRVMGIYERLT